MPHQDYAYRHAITLSEEITPTGTISVTNGSATVTGSGTNFASWIAGDKIYLPDGVYWTIDAVVSDTEITLSSNYTGDNASGQSYKMKRINYVIRKYIHRSTDTSLGDHIYLNEHAEAFPDDILITSDDKETQIKHFIETTPHHRWQETPPAVLPEEIADQTCAVYDGKIYVFGGYGTGGPAVTLLDTVYVYDPSDNTWTQKNDMPAVRVRACAVTVGDKIFLFAGSTDMTPANATKTMWEYDPATDTWDTTTHPDAPAGNERLSCNGCYNLNSDGEVHIFGGRMKSDSSSTKTHISYDPVGENWTTNYNDMPDARQGFPLTVYGGNLYIATGLKITGGSVFSAHNTCWKYVPSTDTWSALATAPLSRFGCMGRTGFNNFLYVDAGKNVAAFYANTQRYDIDRDKWTMEENSYHPHDGNWCEVVTGEPDKMYIIGGRDANGTIAHDWMQLFGLVEQGLYIQIPELASDVDTVIYLYYGYAGASNSEDSSILDFYDDFSSDTSGDYNNVVGGGDWSWNTNTQKLMSIFTSTHEAILDIKSYTRTNVAMRARIMTRHSGNYGGFYIRGDGTVNNKWWVDVENVNDDARWRKTISGVSSDVVLADLPEGQDERYSLLEVIVFGTRAIVIVNTIEEIDSTDSDRTSGSFGFRHYGAAGGGAQFPNRIYVDFITIRKVAYPEPSATYAGELLNQQKLVINSTPITSGISITVDGSPETTPYTGWFAAGGVVVVTIPLTVYPDSGEDEWKRQRFQKWSDDNTDNPRSITMDDNYTFSLVLEEYYTTPYTQELDDGEQYRITMPDPHDTVYDFKEWREDSVTNRIKTVDIDEDKTVTADYDYPIVLNSTSENLILDDSFEFTATPDGTAPYNYSWRKVSDGSVIGTSQSYTLNASAWGVGTHQIYCKVTDTNSVIVDSAIITVTIYANPTIIISPTTVTLIVNESITFTAVQSGGITPVTIEWFDGNGVSLGTGTTYTFTGVTQGLFSIYAVATDAESNIATSDSSSIEVKLAGVTKKIEPKMREEERKDLLATVTGDLLIADVDTLVLTIMGDLQIGDFKNLLANIKGDIGLEEIENADFGTLLGDIAEKQLETLITIRADLQFRHRQELFGVTGYIKTIWERLKKNKHLRKLLGLSDEI
jgi:N-acetylneuraminic acid mutarotase